MKYSFLIFNLVAICVFCQAIAIQNSTNTINFSDPLIMASALGEVEKVNQMLEKGLVDFQGRKANQRLNDALRAVAPVMYSKFVPSAVPYCDAIGCGPGPAYTGQGYLVVEKLILNGADPYAAVQISLQNLPLQESPLLSVKDFMKYRCSDHSFELTEEGIRKIPEGQLKGLPFVFVAHNSKIYLGAFWTSYSSFEFGYPVIDTEWFKVTGELKIARSYPHDGYAVGNDPRADSSIIEELNKNNLLTVSCP